MKEKERRKIAEVSQDKVIDGKVKKLDELLNFDVLSGRINISVSMPIFRGDTPREKRGSRLRGRRVFRRGTDQL